MNEPTTCSHCGYSDDGAGPAGATHCPRCGEPLAADPARPFAGTERPAPVRSENPAPLLLCGILGAMVAAAAALAYFGTVAASRASALLAEHSNKPLRFFDAREPTPARPGPTPTLRPGPAPVPKPSDTAAVPVEPRIDTPPVKPTTKPAPPKDRGEWDGLDVTQARVMDGFLRVSGSGAAIKTRKSYAGPIEIRMVVRTAEADAKKQNVRLSAFRNAMVIFNWELNAKQLRVHRLEGGIGTADVTPLEANRWYTIVWRITKSGMTVLVDNKPVFFEKRANKLEDGGPVEVRNAFSSVVDVKEFTVEEVKED